MIYLLDTNACIQLWQRKNLTVRKRFKQESPATIAICSVVKAELIFGAYKSVQKDANLALLQLLFAPLNSYDFNDNAAEHYADIRAYLTMQGNMIGANDLMIAAIARANKLTLITHNTSEFERVPDLLTDDW